MKSGMVKLNKKLTLYFLLQLYYIYYAHIMQANTCRVQGCVSYTFKSDHSVSAILY